MPSRRPSASPTRGAASPAEPRRDSYAARLAALRAAAPAAPTAPRSGDTYAESSGLTSAASGLGSNLRSGSRSERSEGSSVGSIASYIGAPTPYNTYIESAGHDYSPTASQTASVYVGGPTDTYISDYGDYEPPPSHPHYGGAAASGISNYLSPSSSRHTSYPAHEVPVSSRPVPAPPQQIRSIISNDGSELAPVMSAVTTRTSSTPDQQHASQGRIKGFLSRRGSKTVVDRDTLRLQQLGYDAVLGRDYTFWSSLAIAWLNINSVQVSFAHGLSPSVMVAVSKVLSEPSRAFIFAAPHPAQVTNHSHCLPRRHHRALACGRFRAAPETTSSHRS